MGELTALHLRLKLETTMGENITTKGINTRSSRRLQPRAGQAETALFRQERQRNAATRLAEKTNINKGLTAAQRKSVENFENKHRNYKTERVAAIGKDGRILGQSKSGKRNNTSLPLGNYKDAVITHNHPGAMHGNTTRYGSSLTAPDIRTAAANDAAEIRAVGGSYTYSIRRPKSGWPSNMGQFHKEWMSRWNATQADAAKYIKSGNGHNDIMRRYRRSNTMAAHQINKDLAKKYGLEYTRRKTK